MRPAPNGQRDGDRWDGELATIEPVVAALEPVNAVNAHPRAHGHEQRRDQAVPKKS
jgi:hypothetical protein